MSNKTEIFKYLGMLSIVFQDKKTSEEFFEIYYELLKDYPSKALIDGIKDCLKECRFFPTIAEIRQKTQGYAEHIYKLEIEHDRELKLLEQNNQNEKKQAAYRQNKINQLTEKKEKGIATQQEIELLQDLKYTQNIKRKTHE